LISQVVMVGTGSQLPAKWPTGLTTKQPDNHAKLRQADVHRHNPTLGDDLPARPWAAWRIGRPPLDPQIAAMIVQFKHENPLWRAREELRRLGISVSAPTIQKILRQHGLHPRSRPEIGSWSSRRRATPSGQWTSFLSER